MAKKPLWLSFQAKTGWKRLKNSEKKKLSFHFVPTRRIRDNSKKIAKKFKKLKNPVMVSFQAKIGWKRPRKRENKNCLYVPFLPEGNYKNPKKVKKK